MQKRDLTGMQFGFLTVLNLDKVTGEGNRKRYYYKCRCKCGKEKLVRYDALLRGDTKSCGCWVSENPTYYKHGFSRTRLYRVFRDMKTRCYNKNSPDYKSYGAKGVKICDEWLNNYLSFKKWAEENGYDENAPKGQCTIDRINVEGIYEPSNCRWITISEQNRNKRKKGVK